MTLLKYALIGCGRISPSHIKAAKECKEIEIVAVCDLDENKAKETVNRFGLNAEVYTDYKQMLKECRPDICAVATYSGNHAKIAEEAILSGANVLVEKPIALDIDEARRLNALAEEKNKVLAVCFQNRYNKAVQCLKKAYSDRKFGKLLYSSVQIRWHRGNDYYKSDDWRGTWELDGGALMNQCIHGIDLLLWVMQSEPIEVFSYTALQNHEKLEAEDLGLILIKFENGTYGTVEGTTNSNPVDMGESLAVFGTDGCVKLGGAAANKIDFWSFAGSDETAQTVAENYDEYFENVYGQGHFAIYKNLVKAVTEGALPIADARDGIKAISVILGAYKSSKEGKPVKLPLQNCKTSDFKNLF